MDTVHDLLLFVALAVPPAILAYLLYLGLAISRGEDHRVITTRKPVDNKHPYSLQP